jgi:hypothetical protein
MKEFICIDNKQDNDPGSRKNTDVSGFLTMGKRYSFLFETDEEIVCETIAMGKFINDKGEWDMGKWYASERFISLQEQRGNKLELVLE